jgi:hypothetical protein
VETDRVPTAPPQRGTTAPTAPQYGTAPTAPMASPYDVTTTRQASQPSFIHFLVDDQERMKKMTQSKTYLGALLSQQSCTLQIRGCFHIIIIDPIGYCYRKAFVRPFFSPLDPSRCRF